MHTVTVTDANSDGAVDSTNLNLTGQVELDASCGGCSPLVRLTFSLSDGLYGAAGVTFNDGTVQVEVCSPISGWLPYGTVDASSTPLPFVSGVTGPCGTTAGAESAAELKIYSSLTKVISLLRWMLFGWRPCRGMFYFARALGATNGSRRCRCCSNQFVERGSLASRFKPRPQAPFEQTGPHECRRRGQSAHHACRGARVRDL